MSSEGGLLVPWLLYFPRLAQTWTQGADRDLANSKRLQATIVGIVLHFYLGTIGKGQLKERAVSEGLSFSLSLSFLSALAFCSVSVALLPPLISPYLPCPCPSYFLFFSSPFPWSLLLPSFLLSSVLLISLPQHPVPYLWCVLVLAKARPGRTGGYLLRQRSPWAPTLFPPPGAAQVSRWKVRGARWGRQP